MAEAPLIFYAEEDERTLDVLRKHLYTLDIVPDRVVLHASRIGPHLRQVKEERLFIILVSVDSLVIFKECMGMLGRMIQQRQQRFGATGVISILCRPCAWRESMLEKTQILSHPDDVPITTRGKIDQACLDVARQIKDYQHYWDSHCDETLADDREREG
jgi:hypothetical protein